MMGPSEMVRLCCWIYLQRVSLSNEPTKLRQFTLPLHSILKIFQVVEPFTIKILKTVLIAEGVQTAANVLHTAFRVWHAGHGHISNMYIQHTKLNNAGVWVTHQLIWILHLWTSNLSTVTVVGLGHKMFGLPCLLQYTIVRVFSRLITKALFCLQVSCRNLTEVTSSQFNTGNTISSYLLVCKHSFNTSNVCVSFIYQLPHPFCTTLRTE